MKKYTTQVESAHALTREIKIAPVGLNKKYI
jgi:hypothetical protein